MKKTQVGLGVLVLVLLMALVFAGCGSDGAGGDGGSASRTPVQDGRFVTTAMGQHTFIPIEVATTFVSNTIVDISIGKNEETPPILDTVKALLLPRIVSAQSTGVDNISGATMSSTGVKKAVEAAIEKAGGKAEEWRITPPRSDKKVVLTGYDVIVVGMGGGGTLAYLKASEPVTKNGSPYYPKVFGIEAAGKIGGTSAQAGGPMGVNSAYIKQYYGIGDYVDRDALFQQWLADMEADTTTPAPAGTPALTGNLTRTSFISPDGIPGKLDLIGSIRDYPYGSQTGVTPRYQGGPKWEIIQRMIDESGATVDMLGRDYNFNFQAPTGLSYPEYNPVLNYGTDKYLPPPGMPPFAPPGYSNDNHTDPINSHKAVMFTRALNIARGRNPDNDYVLELRANKLTRLADGQITVEANFRNGTATYMVTGKTVILGTGGYIGNRDMKMQYYGNNLREDAVLTSRGDGITMAMRDMNAETYNIDMPGTVHEANIKNIDREPYPGDSNNNWKPTLTSLMGKGDNMIVGLKKGNTGNDPRSQIPDLRGKRFANEGSSALEMTSVAFSNWKVAGSFAAIFSNDALEGIKANGTPFTFSPLFHGQGNPIPPNTPIPALDQILAMGEAQGNVVKAANIEALAEALGIGEVVEALKAEIKKYNSYVDGTATDPDFDKSNVPPSFFDPPGTPSRNYYTTKVTENCPTGYTAILGEGYYYGTTAGLDVDYYMRVLDKNKQVIPGLYAVGQDSSGVLFNARKAYVGYGAAAQGWAVTSGRLAGEHARQVAVFGQ